MRWTNYHCHNTFCDGRAEAEDFVLAAIEKKFDTLGFSSHAPIPVETVWSMKLEKLDAYLAKISELKNKYHESIQLFTGLEVDYIPNVCGVHSELIQQAKTDYLIASIHFLDGFDNGEHWAIDGALEYFINGYKTIFNADPKKMVRRFTEVSAEMMLEKGFDIVGHIDKIYQHGNHFIDCNDNWYRNEIISLLELAKQLDLIVEINTKSFEKLGFFYPHQSFFKEMHRLGNKITINSDTHQPDMMDHAYLPARDLLKAAGFKHTYEFDGQQWGDHLLE